MRSGPAFASRSETGRRSRTSGRDSRTNGRMLLRSCGVASRANGRTASLAGSSARAAGRSFSRRRAEQLGERLDAPERVGRLLQRARQLVHGARDVGLLLGERVEHGGGGVDEPREVVVARGELLAEHVERRDQVAQLLAPRRDGAVDAREVAVGRLEAGEQVAQVAAAPLEAAAERR